MKKILIIAAGLACLGLAADAALIAHWDLDEVAGSTTAIDSVGGADLTAGGTTVTAGVAGKDGTAWSFSGGTTDNRLGACADNSAFQTLGFSGFSYSAWFNYTSGMTIFSISDAAAGSEEAALRVVSGQLNFSGRHNTYANVEITGGTVTAGQWHHAAVTSTNGSTILYLDGAPVASLGEGVDITSFTANYANLDVNIGANNDNGADFQWEFGGSIDEVRVYNHALTQSEVTVLASIPEPATLGLMTMALGAITFIRRLRFSA